MFENLRDFLNIYSTEFEFKKKTEKWSEKLSYIIASIVNTLKYFEQQAKQGIKL